jgi:hypothetical protein
VEDDAHEDFGVLVKKLEMSRVGENGKAEYRSCVAFGVGTPDSTAEIGSGPK